MSNLITYTNLIAELDVEIRKVLPSDPLQFCHKWFSTKLELERNQTMKESTTKNSLGLQCMGTSSGNFKRNFDGFTLGGGNDEVESKDLASTFDFKKRRMGIHGQPIDVELLQKLSPRSISTPLFEIPSNPTSTPPTTSTIETPISIPTIPLPPSPGRKRASRATFASNSSSNMRRRRTSHLTTPPLSPPTSSTSSSSSNSSDSDQSDSSNSLNSRNTAGRNSKYNQASTSTGIPIGFKLERRSSVSSESLNPHYSHPFSTSTIISQSKASSRIKSLPNNLLFRNLNADQFNDVVNSMKEVTFNKGTEVIVQGAVGEFFYIVESGTLEAWQESKSTTTTSSGGQLSRVATYGPGDSFGELALMYNCSRKATIVTTSTQVTLWTLDRITFKKILLESNFKNRNLYSTLLSSLNLDKEERFKIVDGLNEIIIQQGEKVNNNGRNFFLISSGSAQVFRKKSGLGGDREEEEVLVNLKQGDYFGGEDSINSIIRATPGKGQLRLGVISELAFTRLIGPKTQELFQWGKN